jgi:membrane-associated phospholipid phosphatase
MTSPPVAPTPRGVWRMSRVGRQTPAHGSRALVNPWTDVTHWRSIIPLRRSDHATLTARAGSLPGMRWPLWQRRAALVVLWLLGAVALGVLSLLAHHYAEFFFDRPVTLWLQQALSVPPLTRFINLASDANWPVPAGAAVISATVGLALLRRYRAALVTALAGFGAANVSFIINGLVARPRPVGGEIQVIANIGLHSYPSGHVSQVVSFYGFLLYLSIRARKSNRTWPPLMLWLLVVQAICVYFLVFIGPSRVLQGEHWPSDVLGSYLVGGLWLALMIALYHWLGVGQRWIPSAWRATVQRAEHTV